MVIGRPLKNPKGPYKENNFLLINNGTFMMSVESLFFIFVSHLNLDQLLSRNKKEEEREGGEERGKERIVTNEK